MLDSLVQLDKEWLIYFNGLGSEPYDGFWLFVTKQTNWIPFFLVLLYLTYRKVSLKTLGVIILLLAALVAFTDQMTNLVKYAVARPRPCNTEDIKDLIRVVKCSPSLSFFSGHASNSMANMLFMFLVLKRYYKQAYLVFIFPLIFAYSRIYLTMHFPFDILVGYCFGLVAGTLFYQLFLWIERKYADKLI